MQTWGQLILSLFPLTVWILSYLVLVREFGRWDLRRTLIHETGRYTLRETIFYYDHFLRELPIDGLFAWAILWSYAAAGVQVPRLLPWAGAASVALIAFLLWIFGGSVHAVGWKPTMLSLFQYRETDTRSGWGTHWQMHFLSTAVCLLLFMLPGVLFAPPADLRNQALLILGIFLGLSAVFGCGWKALTHPRWILHGAREIFTYVVTVGLPALGLLWAPAVAGRVRLSAAAVAMLMAVAAAAGYIFAVYRRTDLNAEASSSRGLLFLLSGHFFEHMLDVIYIALLILAFG
jgi:hypothetical protein